MKGIILAGGSGTRLLPLTKVTNKHLLPVYNKPMIYYPIGTLKYAGITDILIISGKGHAGHFLDLLGSGSDFGVNFSYEIQEEAGGIAQALGLAERFADNDAVAVILGDNIFQSKKEIARGISVFKNNPRGAKIFLKSVSDAHRFGVATVRGDRVLEIIEKPAKPKSPYAVTGLYLYDEKVFSIIKELKPSKRGELEITDVNNRYIKWNEMKYSIIKEEWTDAGTFPSLLRAGVLVKKSICGGNEKYKDNG